ncbi:hypothetical protein OE88DRAFT_153601 [Heliocybe sulcata]|uniref:Uncharacterized protein n=1 Tax=Heliocybe sulcata TaxID=5364 RepID=A0A5C3NI61_9AGAM|nr:hypothetical protein OE88DRAFT_153601 [Heliocybe sulcata]
MAKCPCKLICFITGQPTVASCASERNFSTFEDRLVQIRRSVLGPARSSDWLLPPHQDSTEVMYRIPGTAFVGLCTVLLDHCKLSDWPSLGRMPQEWDGASQLSTYQDDYGYFWLWVHCGLGCASGRCVYSTGPPVRVGSYQPTGAIEEASKALPGVRVRT